MRRRGPEYSRIVGFAKVVLPIAAIAVLSSLFLFSKSYDPSQNVLLGNSTLEDYAANERITAPRFAGMTPSGVTIQLSARQGQPRKTGGPAFDAENLNAHIEAPDGTNIDMQSAVGSVDGLAQISELAGGVVLITSHGFIAETEGLTFALNRLDIRSHGQISAEGPLGAIKAGEMHITENPDVPCDVVLVFNGGVKLIYTP